MASEVDDNVSVESGEGNRNLFGSASSSLHFPSAAAFSVGEGDQVESTPVEASAQHVSHVNFGHAVGAAWDALASDTVEPIWNSGFWKCIFGDDAFGPKLENNFKRPVPVDETAYMDETSADVYKKQCLPSSSVLAEPLFRSCVKSSEDVTWQEKREAHLQRALKHWLVISSSWTREIEFVQCLSGCDSVNAQLIMLGDVFRGKAPSTLTKRANSMKFLCEQLELVGHEFPCTEPALYGILCKLRQQGFPASKSKGILEAIAFVRYCMGVTECDVLLKGRRCWGASTTDTPTQKRQASPLRVSELVKLHNILEFGHEVWDRMFCGAVLFVTYSRARWSDAQHSSRLTFDRDGDTVCYVEALTGLHKTARALQHRHQFLPLVAPAVGVTEQNWGVLWENVRKELAISFEDGFPLMPAPLETGLPGKRALDSEEAGRWLRALLELSDHDVSERKVSSHSLKCTMLSFLAKRGVDMPDRLLLGYHTSPFTMGLTYSRDGMARPLQILGEMLSEIREGTYMPDCTRSGRLVKKADTGGGLAVSLESTQDATKIEISDDEGELNVWELIQTAARAEPAKALPEVIPENCETEINDACTETSSSDVSETEEADTSFEDTGRKTFEPPTAPEGFTMWQHTKSKILHLVNYKTPGIFECGRKPGAFHTCDGIHPRWDSGICWKCFKHR